MNTLNSAVDLDLDDDALAPFVWQARRLFESGRTELAKDLLRTLILLAPRALTAWELLARCHDRAKEPEVARLLRATSSAIGAYTAQGARP